MTIGPTTSLPFLLLLVGLLIGCIDAEKSSTEEAVSAPTNAPYSLGTSGRNSASRQDSPYLLLISIDGFRGDYLDLYPAPAIENLATSGLV